MSARQPSRAGRMGGSRETTDADSERLGYLVLSFGVLLAVAYRSFVLREQSWDLLALVVVGGLVRTGAQLSRRPLERRDLVVIGLTIGVAVVFGAVIALVVRG